MQLHWSQRTESTIIMIYLGWVSIYIVAESNGTWGAAAVDLHVFSKLASLFAILRVSQSP